MITSTSAALRMSGSRQSVPVSVPLTRLFHQTAPCLPEAEAPVQGKELWMTPSAELRSMHRTSVTCEPLSKRLVQAQEELKT